MLLRTEQPADADAIHALTGRAFASAPHSNGSEPRIVRGLRAAGALAISLVAEDAGVILGHVAISPISISDGSAGWYGLGPISVDPAHQRQGIGSALVLEGLARLRNLGAAGCVVLGDPAYYSRFGFSVQPGLIYPGPPPEHFMARPFACSRPSGHVVYHAAFQGEA